jgi:outer membrane protein OmpA-like peptidoglycan-associated protein
MRLYSKIVFLLLLFSGYIYIDKSYSQVINPVEIKITSLQRFETRPRKTITLSVIVKNNSEKKKLFASQTILPPKWKVTPPDGKFELNPNESITRIINISIPAEAQADSFKISYSIEDAVDPSITASALFTIIIKPVIDVKFELLSKPRYVLAGNDYKMKIRMTNESNLAMNTSLDLHISGHPEFRVTGAIDTANFTLEPGASRILELSGTTDSRIDQKRIYNYQIIPVFSNIKDTVNFQFFESLEIIPNKYTVGDIWHEIPITITMRAVTENQPKPFWVNMDQNPPRLYGFQAEITGKGSFYENSKDKFEFTLKAPNIQEKSPSFWKRDEYYFKYYSDKYDVTLGDSYYNLSYLTDMGSYSLGAGGNYTFSNYKVGGYAENNRWSIQKENTIGTYISYGEKGNADDTTADLYRLRFNLMNKSDVNNRLAASIQGYDSHYKFANLDGEYGISQSNGLSGSAYKMDLNGKFLFADYTARMVRSNSDYYGSIRDLSLINGSLKISPFKQLSFTSYFNRLETNLNRDTLLGSAPRNTLIQFGFNNGYLLNFSVIVSKYDWENLLKSTEGYTENKIQASTSFDFGLQHLYGLFEYTISKDRLTGKELSSKRLYVNSSINSIDRFDLGLSANYTEMSNFYLFDNIRAIGFGLNILWRITYTTNFFMNAALTKYLSDNTKSFYSVETYSYIEAKLEQKLFGDHLIALSSRNTLYKSQYLSNKIAAMLEYSIPLRIPVSKKTTVGVLRGKVYEVEKPDQGVSDVEIMVNDLSVISDKEGNFILSYITPGLYNVSINKFSLGKARTTLQKMPILINIRGGEETIVNIGIIKSSLIRGKILAYGYEETGGVDPSQRKLEVKGGVPDFSIMLKNGKPDFFTATSNNRGEFNFTDVPAGKWHATIIAGKIPEYQILEKDSIEVLISPGDIKDIEFRLLPKKRAAVIAQKIDTVITETPVIKRDTAIVKPKITISSGVAKQLYFNERQDTLNEQTRDYLDRIAEYLKTGNYVAAIEGHSDLSGNIQQDERVATLRMNRVIEYLVKKGVSRRQFTAQQYGGRRPLVPNTTPSNRQRNRRVAIVLNKK